MTAIITGAISAITGLEAGVATFLFSLVTNSITTGIQFLSNVALFAAADKIAKVFILLAVKGGAGQLLQGGGGGGGGLQGGGQLLGGGQLAQPVIRVQGPSIYYQRPKVGHIQRLM